jgi:hypothetical protein
MNRSAEVVRFYVILEELRKKCSGTRLLENCRGKMLWPNRGVYFFLEGTENRTTSGMGNRIVRIGTHALKKEGKTKFWHRLAQHRGSLEGGNHRGSIFRLLIGDALMRKRNQQEPKSWGVGSDPGRAATKLGMSRAEVVASERQVEAAVSKYICMMPFLWIPIEDEAGPNSLRGYVERNSIALLSNYQREPVDPPSDRWLGQFSSRNRVCSSGLWNNNHVDQEHDPDFLNRFEQLVLESKIGS